MTQPYNPWSGLASAPVFERGAYAKPGNYKVKIERILTKQTQKSGLGFIVEMVILESDNPHHQIGSKVTWFQKMQNQSIAFSSIKAFIAAIFGFDLNNAAHKAQFDTDVSPRIEGLMLAAEQDASIIGGRTVRLEVRQTKTQRGMDFSQHVFSPWTAEPGWTATPTPATPAVPQGQAYPVQGYPPPGAYPAPAQGYPPPGAYPAPAQAPAQAPAGAWLPPSPPR